MNTKHLSNLLGLGIIACLATTLFSCDSCYEDAVTRKAVKLASDFDSSLGADTVFTYDASYQVPVNSEMRNEIEKAVIDHLDLSFIKKWQAKDLYEALAEDQKAAEKKYGKMIKAGEGPFVVSRLGCPSCNDDDLVEYVTMSDVTCANTTLESGITVFHFDPTTNKLITMDDFFEGKWKSTLQQLLRANAAQNTNINNPDKLKLHDNFVILAEGISLFINGNDVADSQMSWESVDISYSDFQHLVKPEWKKLWTSDRAKSFNASCPDSIEAMMVEWADDELAVECVEEDTIVEVQ